MCSPDLPDAPGPPKPIASPVDEQVVDDMRERRRKQRMKAGVASTILTNSGELDEATGHKPSLLGG